MSTRRVKGVMGKIARRNSQRAKARETCDEHGRASSESSPSRPFDTSQALRRAFPVILASLAP